MNEQTEQELQAHVDNLTQPNQQATAPASVPSSTVKPPCGCEPSYGFTCPGCEAETRLKPVTRYDLVTNYRCGDAIEELERAECGEWVRYDDVIAAMSVKAEGRS